MRTSIVPIGNSKGIRIPSIILKQCHISNYVDMEIENETIVIKPVQKDVRKGWNEKFIKMRKNNEDKLLIDDNLDLNLGDWEWK
jgi:antitoxin MazE